MCVFYGRWLICRPSGGKIRYTHSTFPDKKAIKDATNFLKTHNIDFHSEDKNVPKELPALYDNTDPERTQLTIYSPREGYIENATEIPSFEAQNSTFSKDTDWMYFSSAQTDYAVKI